MIKFLGSVFPTQAEYPMRNRGLLMNTQGLILYFVKSIFTLSLYFVHI